MVSRCRSTIGKKLANIIRDTFHSIPTGENGAIAKVERSTPNLTSCGPCTSGVTRCLRMRSRYDLSEKVELAKADIRVRPGPTALDKHWFWSGHVCAKSRPWFRLTPSAILVHGDKEIVVPNESRLMDSLHSATPPVSVQPATRVRNFWGTALWGVLIFVAMLVGQVSVVGIFALGRGGPVDLAATLRSLPPAGWRFRSR